MATRPTLYENLADHLTSLMESGSLLPGDRLPSIRRLAAQQRVSISTVLQAYLLLESRGLVEARPQSGHYVKARLRPPLPVPRTPKLESTARLVTIADRVVRLYRSSDGVFGTLGIAVPDPSLLPTEKLARFAARAARAAGTAAVAYGPPEGMPSLRQELARRSATWGSPIAADEILVTVGGMEALHLALRALARRGDVIAVESPAFFGVLQLIESLGLRVVEIPAHADSGMDLGVLDAALRHRTIRAVLAVPSFSNPLGSSMPDAARRELVRILTRYDVPLIEDDVYGDLPFDGERPRLARSFDRRGLVLVCSSFSKTLAPGYRVGWIAPGRYRTAIERLKFAQSVTSPVLPQLAIAEFLRAGGYDHHLRKLRRRLRSQVERYAAEISARFPPGTRLSRPRGGFVLWVELPSHVDSLELQERALAEKIVVAPGPIFSASGGFRNFLRIGCGHLWTEETERALQTVADIARELAER